MNKRRISLALVMLLLVVAVLPTTALSATWSAYVYTSNGKGLNLRPGPSTSMAAIATIPYGAKVHLNDYIDQTWVKVDYGNLHGFVMGRYLTYEQPPAKPSPKPTAKPAPSQSSFKEVFKGFTFASYVVQVRPSTPGGLVHMRWAPTKASDPIRDYHQNDQLQVIAQNGTWAQVVDQSTGITGFMMRSFLADIGYGIVADGAEES